MHGTDTGTIKITEIQQFCVIVQLGIWKYN